MVLRWCCNVLVARAKSTLATVKERIEEHKQERSRELLHQQQQQAEAPLQLAPLSQGLAARRSMALEGQATAMAAAAAVAQQHRQQPVQQQPQAYQQLQQRRSTDMGSPDQPTKGSTLQSAATVHPASGSSSSTGSQPLAKAVCGDAAAASPNRPAAAVAGSGSPSPEALSPQPLMPGTFGSSPLDVMISACQHPPGDAAGYGPGQPPGSAACSSEPLPGAQQLYQRHSAKEPSTPSPAQPFPASDRAPSPVDPYLPTAYTAPPGAGLGRVVAAGTASSPGDTRAAAVAAGSLGPGGMDPLNGDSVLLPGAASAPARGVGVSREGADVASGGRGERDVDRGRGLEGQDQQVLELLREPLLRGDPREEVELSSRAVPVGGRARVDGRGKGCLGPLTMCVLWDGSGQLAV